MSSIKPEPGMTYKFDVEGAFDFDNSITFLGHPSVEYITLYPAKADVIVDETLYTTVNIIGNRMTGTSEKRAIMTYDKIDIAPLKGKKVILNCTFESRNER